MTDIEEVLARVHELDQAATTGPWEASQDSNEHLAGCPPTMEWLVTADSGYEAIIDWGNHGTRADAELVAEYRTLAPRMAKGLQAVLAIHEPVDALHYGPKNSRKVEVCIGCGADDGNWNQWPCPTVRAVQEALRDDHL